MRGYRSRDWLGNWNKTWGNWGVGGHLELSRGKLSVVNWSSLDVVHTRRVHQLNIWSRSDYLAVLNALRKCLVPSRAGDVVRCDFLFLLLGIVLPRIIGRLRLKLRFFELLPFLWRNAYFRDVVVCISFFELFYRGGRPLLIPLCRLQARLNELPRHLIHSFARLGHLSRNSLAWNMGLFELMQVVNSDDRLPLALHKLFFNILFHHRIFDRNYLSLSALSLELLLNLLREEAFLSILWEFMVIASLIGGHWHIADGRIAHWLKFWTRIVILTLLPGTL